jgi:hypothetical protein
MVEFFTARWQWPAHDSKSPFDAGCKARLNHIDPQAFELAGNTQLLIFASWMPPEIAPHRATWYQK